MKHHARLLVWFALAASLVACAKAVGTTPPAPTTTLLAGSPAVTGTATTGPSATPGTARASAPPRSSPATAGATPALAPPPTGCGGPQPQSVATFFGSAIGASPVWASRFVGPEATLHVGFDGNLDQVTRDERGWGVKVLLVVEPQQAAPMTIRVVERATGSPITIEVNARAPAQVVVLDPKDPAIPVQHGEWKEFPSNWWIPRAGCYDLEITGPKGAARIPFGAGR